MWECQGRKKAGVRLTHLLLMSLLYSIQLCCTLVVTLCPHRYENTHDKDNLPALAYQPMQSNEYLAKLAEKHEKQMPMELDTNQNNAQHAMISLAGPGCLQPPRSVDRCGGDSNLRPEGPCQGRAPEPRHSDRKVETVYFTLTTLFCSWYFLFFNLSSF